MIGSRREEPVAHAQNPLREMPVESPKRQARTHTHLPMASLQGLFQIPRRISKKPITNFKKTHFNFKFSTFQPFWLISKTKSHSPILHSTMQSRVTILVDGFDVDDVDAAIKQCRGDVCPPEPCRIMEDCVAFVGLGIDAGTLF